MRFGKSALHHVLSLPVITVLLSTSVLCRNAEAEKPIAANSIADSVGINVHLHYTDTPYKNFPLVKSLLTDLGVHHIRDGVVDTTWNEYYLRHNELGRLGIKCLFVTNAKQSDDLLARYPTKMRDSFEGYEAPNEYNQSGDAHWVDTLKAFLPRLQSAIQNAPTKGAILVGPSLTQPNAYSQAAGLENYFDYANLHNYLAGRNPGTAGWGGGGYGSIEWNLKLARGAWADKPVMTTETGFNTDPENKQALSELDEGIYMPRLILEQLMHHIHRTYIYELIDVGAKVNKNDAQFGIVHNDGSKKPAYVALKNLIGMTQDSGHTATLDEVPTHFSGKMDGVHHLLAKKSDGSLLLFFWIEQPSFDQQNKKALTVQDQSITLELPKGAGDLEQVSFASSGEITRQKIKPSASLSLVAKQTLTILTFKP